MTAKTLRAFDVVSGLFRVLTKTGPVLLASGVLSCWSVTAQAQTTSQVYAAKFVCGFKTGFTPPQENVLLQPAIHPYRDFEPGSYATTLNILFANALFFATPVEVFVSVPRTPDNAAIRGVNVGTFTVQSFGSTRVDCEDIATAIESQLPGTFRQIPRQEIIEGFLYITRNTDDLAVEAVYTHSSQIGSLGSEPVNGAGIGLGTSVQVRNIEPRPFDELLVLR